MQNDTDKANLGYTAKKKYRSYHVQNVFFVHHTSNVNLVGVVLCVEKFKVGGKSTFRTQNDTDSANFRYTANKKYCSLVTQFHKKYLQLNSRKVRVLTCIDVRGLFLL